jgi:ATP-dependent HslUV protease ATP-binding subunit HslU
VAVEVNESIENIGARRLHSLLEKLLEEIGFEASDKPDGAITIDGDFAKNVDLSKFIL